ncbi:MAG: hypothetical protein JXB48_03205 [Candidatus Latescibacteria bacterium]|nr:hypothetical protein [Candidatus Latescibacterota bacterium]
MKSVIHRSAAFIVALVLLTTIGSGCGLRPFGGPPGDNIGSCKGKMRLTSGENVRFSFDVFKHDENLAFYISIPQKGIRYMAVEDVSFDDGVVHVEGKLPHQEYEGRIIGNSVTFDGQWNRYKGSFTLKIDD